ncbi:MAG: domain containing protein [Bacteroidetes bacterium]|nr:domain containing protein [Bacteroidota bacterium]
MINRFLVLLFFILAGKVVFSQNSQCANPTPFCTGQTMQFPAGVNAGNAQVGPNYGCLGSQPNPAWFYFQIGSAGPLVITMAAASDIDYISYGPFASLTGNCGNLTAANTVGCSYSGSATETLTIANAVPGQFYLLMITNFSNSNQQITFSQTNSNAPGAAQTNCGVLCSMTVSATNSLCAGNTATLGVTTGSQVVSVTWSGPAGYSSPVGNTNIPNMTSSGVYTALATTTGTNPATNTCSITKSITVVPSPTLVISNNGPVCAGSQANFTVTGAASYNWSGPNGFGSNISTPFIPNAQPSNSGNYTVLGTSNTCTATATSSLTVKANPTVTASNSGAYCVGQSFTLAASGASTYAWSGPAAFNTTSQNPVFTNNQVSYSGTYTVLGTTNGCTATANTNVNINPLPVIIPVSSGNVCEHNSFTLSASGATAYAWTGPMGFNAFSSSVSFNNALVTMTGTYNVSGTDANGCVNSATIAQFVNPVPSPLVFGANKCLNEDLPLTASGGTNYQWSGPNGFTSNQQNPVIANAQFGNSGVYTVTVTAAGCSATGTANCTIFANPIISFTGVTEICKGGVFSFVANGGLDYKWLTMFGEISQSNSFTISTTSPQLQSTYTLVGVDGNGCHDQVVIYPLVLGLPYASVSAVKEGDCIPFSTRFNMSNMASNITSINWNFSNGTSLSDSSSVIYNVTSAGIHTVNIALTDNRGCKGAASGTVEGFPIPAADFIFNPEIPTNNDDYVSFTNQTTNARTVEWYWDFYSNSQNISTKENPSYYFPEPGNYFVFFKVKSDHGCTDSIVKKLTVIEDISIFIPNAFTPNGDGLNENFIPKTVGLKKLRMDIFDRWGELIFTTSDPAMGWDGRHKKGGDILPQGVYVYRVSAIFNNGSKPKQYTGHVTLLR